MWNKTNYEAQAEHLRRAGMNIGLMYGSAGQGGQTNAVSGEGGKPNTQQPLANTTAMAGMGIQNELARVQKENIEAQTAKTEAETENIEGKTSTENQTRDILVANMKESGISQWMDNVARDWQRQYSPDDKGDAVEVYQHAIYGTTQICYRDWETDRKSTRLNSSHSAKSRMPSSA